MTDRVPTKDEINVYDSLDEACAVTHFLGKNLTESEMLFRENFLVYQEDLLFMGPKAFCYYAESAINYLSSADCDDFEVGGFCNVVEHRLKHENLFCGPSICDGIRRVLRRLQSDPNSFDDAITQCRSLLAKFDAHQNKT